MIFHKTPARIHQVSESQKDPLVETKKKELRDIASIQKTPPAIEIKQEQPAQESAFQKKSYPEIIDRFISQYDRTLGDEYYKKFEYLKDGLISHKGIEKQAHIVLVQLRSKKGATSSFQAAIDKQTGSVLQTWGHQISESPLAKKSFKFQVRPYQFNP